MSTHVSVAEVGQRVGVSMLVACVVPALLFFTAFRISGVGLAMGSALTWSYGAMVFRALTGRRVSGMLVVTSVILTARTLVAVLANSAFLYFVQPAISDAVLGSAFLLSLVVGRPLCAKLAGDFLPMTEAVAAGPGMQLLFRRLTAGWSAYLIGKAALIAWLLTHLSISGYVSAMTVTGPVMNLLAGTATLAAAGTVLLREGLIGGPLLVDAMEPVALVA